MSYPKHQTNAKHDEHRAHNGLVRGVFWGVTGPGKIQIVYRFIANGCMTVDKAVRGGGPGLHDGDARNAEAGEHADALRDVDEGEVLGGRHDHRRRDLDDLRHSRGIGASPRGGGGGWVERRLFSRYKETHPSKISRCL